MHNVIWDSKTMPKFREKLMTQFQENTDLWKNMPLPATTGGLINARKTKVLQ